MGKGSRKQGQESLRAISHPIKKRIVASVAFGLAGFAVNFLDLELVPSPAFKVSILLGLFFPLVIALAWVWRYGLLPALTGDTWLYRRYL